MSSNLNTADGPVDAQAASPDAPPLWLEVDPPPFRLLGEGAPRPAPANWRGCGYRRLRTTLNGGRAG